MYMDNREYDLWVKTKLNEGKFWTNEELEQQRKEKNENQKLYIKQLRERDVDAFKKYQREQKRRYLSAKKARETSITL